jgi:hypothetical protein
MPEQQKHLESLEPRIGRLPELIAALPDTERALAARLFNVNASEGEIVPPPEMLPWLERTFGSVDAALHQRIVRVTNRWTFEGTTFNPLRSRRPGSGTTMQAATPIADVPEELRERILTSSGDDFCDPLHRTPADMFGRVRGRHVTTAANVAKADGWHGLAIFDQHDPLQIDDELVADILATAAEWAVQVRALDQDARHLFVFWNCLWRAGASLVHGHAQMTLSHAMAHARVEQLRAAARRYQSECDSDYFADLAAVHRALGLSVGNENEEDKVDWFASLTPIKERETMIVAPTYQDGVLDSAELAVLTDQLGDTLGAMRQRMGVFALNVAIFGPPLGPSRDKAGADIDDDWSGFPLVARLVDRGNPLSSTSDIAGLELFGSSVVASDPFETASLLRTRLPDEHPG